MPGEIYDSNRLSVLVVDDNREISRLIKRNLESNNTRVIEAGSGFDGIRILHDCRVDLIILDLKLPDFNGWGILSLLRLTESLSDMPVVLISVEPPDTALIEQFKPDDYVQKPFDTHDLLLRVQKVISSKGNGKKVVL